MGKRDNGTGHIRTVHGANGVRYYAYAPAKYIEQPDGSIKCVRQALGWCAKKADARKLLEDYQRHPSTKYQYTLQQIFEDWKPGYFPDIGESTRTGYLAAWQQIRWANPALMEKPIKEITTTELRAVYDYWMQAHYVLARVGTAKDGSAVMREKSVGPLSKSSMQKIKALLGLLYNHAMANNIVDKNYSALVKIPRDAEEDASRPFSDAEFAILLKNWRAVPGADAILAMCYLGFRVSEFCQLTPASYDPQLHTLTGGLKTEAGYNRAVPVHPIIRPLVESWVAAGGDALYPTKTGKAYTKDSFRKRVFQPALEALGLPDDLTTHSCRKTCATRLSAAGARPEDIQKILGHADYSVTANTYIKQDAQTLAAAIALMQ